MRGAGRFEGPLPVLPCACANLRRATRAVTQLYDEALRPTGLRATQFTLLQVLARADGPTQGRLGEILALDTTTLSRTLRPLEARGWVRTLPGKDQRQRCWTLTAKGQRKLSSAEAHWKEAQGRLRARLGKRDWDHLQSVLVRTTEGALGA